MTNANIIAAIQIAKQKVVGQPAWERSVAKAAVALIAGELLVTVTAGENNGVVTSKNGSYTIRHGFCSCPATVNHCYHISALRIVALADEMPEASAAPVATSDSIESEVKSVRVPSRITKSIEQNHNGQRLTVYRADGWSI